jgi:RNA polymerase sigma-70 factor, ECF subfamily
VASWSEEDFEVMTELDDVRLSDLARTRTFDEVYDAHFDYVHRVVARLSGLRDVEDLVQDVFFVVHHKLPSFRGDSSITTWLFAVCHRVVGAHIRKERIRRLFANAFRVERPAQPATYEPLSKLERKQAAERIVAALDALSWKKRTVVVMYELEGWSCEQIAEALGIPASTVYTRLHHARRDLAHALCDLREKQP